MFSYGLLNMDAPVLVEQQGRASIAFVRTQGTLKRTCLKRLMIGTDGKGETWDSLQLAWRDDDDDE